MSEWTAQDEINFCKWVDDMGFCICYLPKSAEWGYYEKTSPNIILGGFGSMLELKEYLNKLRGNTQNVRAVSTDQAIKALEIVRDIL